jgi:predicted small lipoprotein YifL
MMTRSFLRSTTLAMVAVVSLAGCGAGAPNINEPAGAVSAALDAAEAGGFTKVVDFMCAANKGKAASLFGGADLSSLAALGIDSNSLFDALKVDFQDIKTTETSKSGTNATVHVTGKTVVSFDAAKMKDIVKQILTAQGAPTDDVAVNAAMSAMSGQLTQTQTLDEDVTMVQEGGKWLICE